MRRPLEQQHLSVNSKIARALWQLVWLVLYRPSPIPLHSWRSLLLRLFGARIGKGAHPYPSARVWAPWNLVMGEHSCLSHQVDCYCVDKIELGAHVTVSQYSFLCTATHDYTQHDMPLVTAPIYIGAHAWVTADVFVGPGVTIGEGAVIGVRSTVLHDVPPWSVVAGNPLRVVGQRDKNGIKQGAINE
jgi:putative colanic acid biosynthesis acetyltransferase WcaF